MHAATAFPVFTGAIIGSDDELRRIEASLVSSHPNARPLILCVDDNPQHLKLRKAVLDQNGFNVVCATNAADAVVIFRETPVSCTIADHLLQGQTGVELAKELKTIKRDVPIILYSGTMPTNLQNIDVYINKDEPTVGFLRIVREVVERFRS